LIYLSESQVGEARPPDKPNKEDEDEEEEEEGLLRGGEFNREDGQRTLVSITGCESLDRLKIGNDIFTL
jgi:hypothetical protein